MPSPSQPPSDGSSDPSAARPAMSDAGRLPRPRSRPSGTLAWLLRVAALLFLAAAALMLQAASLQPALVAPNVRAFSPGLDGSVSVTLLAIILVGTISGRRGRKWRVPVGVLLVLGAGVGGLISLTMFPDPGPDGGVGMRGPLAAIGFTLWGFAGAALIVGSRGRPRVRAPMYGSAVLAIAAGVALIAGLVQATLPASLRADNTVATPTDIAPSPARSSKVDGALMWSAGRASLGDENRYATAGGLLATDYNGVTMVDANSGTRRWDYFRYDVVDLSTPRISPDGRRIAVLASQQSPVNILTTRGSTDRLWVFDALSGALLVDRISPYEDASLAAVVSGQLLWKTDPDVEEGTAGRISATNFDGHELWSRGTTRYCKLAEAQQAPQRQILLRLTCSTPPLPDPDANPAPDPEKRIPVPAGRMPNSTLPPKLMLFDADGQTQWRWEAPESDQLRLGPVPHSIRDTLVVHQASGGAAEQQLFGLRIADGHVAWQSEEIQLTADPVPRAADPLAPGNPAPLEHYQRVLRGNERMVVLAESYDLESDVTLAGIDPRTGERRWTTTLPTRPRGRSERELGTMIINLDEQRLAVATLPYDVATPDAEPNSEPDAESGEPGAGEPGSGTSGSPGADATDGSAGSESDESSPPATGDESGEDESGQDDSGQDESGRDESSGGSLDRPVPSEDGTPPTDEEPQRPVQIPGESNGGFTLTSVRLDTGKLGNQIAPDLGRSPAPVTTEVDLHAVRGTLVANAALEKASDLTLGIG